MNVLYALDLLGTAAFAASGALAAIHDNWTLPHADSPAADVNDSPHPTP